MGTVKKPHKRKSCHNHHHQTRQFAKTGNRIKRHILPNNQQRRHHRKNRQYLAQHIRLHHTSAVEQKLIDTQSERKNARNTDQINQSGIQKSPRWHIALAFAHKIRQQSRQRNERKKHHYIRRIFAQKSKKFL